MRCLIALDESEFSERIVGWLRTFPYSQSTIVTVVHVFEPVEIPETLGARGGRTRASATGINGGGVVGSGSGHAGSIF